MDNTKQSIKRTGLPPIVFNGHAIGSGSTHSHQGDSQNRWTEVDIYRTAAGRFIWHLAHMTCWQGEHDYFSGGSCATAAECITALQDDQGNLGRASQEACEEAAKNDPDFKFEEVIE